MRSNTPAPARGGGQRVLAEVFGCLTSARGLSDHLCDFCASTGMRSTSDKIVTGMIQIPVVVSVGLFHVLFAV